MALSEFSEVPRSSSCVVSGFFTDFARLGAGVGGAAFLFPSDGPRALSCGSNSCDVQGVSSAERPVKSNSEFCDIEAVSVLELLSLVAEGFAPARAFGVD